MSTVHEIPLTNGKGSKELVDGTYTVTAEIDGYDNDSIDPTEVTIEEGTNDYSFTIAATGTLTLHVTDDGTTIGVPVEGATFIRCDSEGNTYGTAISSDSEGNAVFNYVPHSATTTIKVYYKQTGSDGSHTFDDTLKETSLSEATLTVEVENSEATAKQVMVTDKNYANLPVGDGTLTLTEN